MNPHSGRQRWTTKPTRGARGDKHRRLSLRRRQLRRTVTLALIIGSVFVAMNQLSIILAGNADTIIWLKVAMTYLTPVFVSNFGVLSATRAKPNLSAAEGR